MVLMHKLGLISVQEWISDEAREAYARLFKLPLSQHQLSTLASIFGWMVPDEGEARSTDVLLY